MHKKKAAASTPDNETPSRCHRSYNPVRRKATQDATRQRILEAAAELLMERGGLAFTIDAVAQRAAVTRQTVYNQFGARADLLAALCENVIDAQAFEAMPQAFQQRDALLGIDRFVDVFCQFWEANRLLMRRMRGLANSEPELEDVIRAQDERRLSAVRGFVERYGLASSEKAEWLIRVMFAMTSFEFFDSLSQGRTSQETVVTELKQLLKECIRNSDLNLSQTRRHD